MVGRFPCVAALQLIVCRACYQVKARVRQAIRKHWSQPLSIIKKYAEFAPLLSGELHQSSCL